MASKHPEKGEQKGLICPDYQVECPHGLKEIDNRLCEKCIVIIHKEGDKAD